jgi:TonB-linked SusC/RagA family outer membrane protein
MLWHTDPNTFDNQRFFMRRIMLLMAVLLGNAAFLSAQTTIKGKVIDAKNGLPIEKARVAIGKEKATTFSKNDGSFELASSVTSGDVFITYVGYAPYTVKFSGNSTLEIKLQQDVKDLSEVVVTALNVSRDKKRIGYTISEVNTGLIEKSREQNVIEALAGKVAGVQVTGASGTPGASSKIIVRGNSTFTGNNQCLVVVDGIPVDNSTFAPNAADPFVNLYGVQESNRAIDINPADIQSLTILKGPAAASLYGARGGNGAIVITTKKGHNSNGKLGVTYSSSIEWSKVNRLPKLQNQFLQGIGGVSQPIQFSFGPKADTVDVPTYDKYDQFFKTGTIFTNNISIDGGTQTSSFRLGAGNSTNNGVIPNSKFERTNISFSAESKLKDWITVGASANYVVSSGKRVQSGNGRGSIMLTLLRAPINYNTDNWIDAAGNEVKYFAAWDNPRFTAERNTYTDKTNRIFGNVYTNVSFTKELSLDWRVGVDYFSTAAKQVYDLTSFANTNGAPGAGQINFSTNSNRQIYSDVMLRYKKQLSSKLELNSMVGLNVWDNQYRFNFDRGTNLQVPGLYTLDNTSLLFATSNESYEQTKALFAEVSLNYNSFLNLTITGRNDWTTAFGRGGGSFFYPKADLAWIFSENIPANKILSYGKLRLALADAGTGPKPYTYDNVVYYSRPNYTDGSVTATNTFPYLGQAGYAPLNIKYPGGLVPAHVVGKEIGLELKFLGNRINLDAVYYIQNSKDNLLQMPIAASTGYNYEYTNAGEIENKGIELSLGADIIKTSKLVWNVSANWSKNSSKVLSLAPGVTQIELEKSLGSVGFYTLVGQPYGVFYGTTWKRNAEGKLLLNDLGQPLINSVKSGLGSPNPDWLMGISSSLIYNNINFSFLFDIRQGGLIYNGTHASLSQYGLTAESADRDRTYMIDGVYDQTATKPGEQNSTAVTSTYYFQTYKGASGATENALEDGSWVRLRSVSLGYRFDKFKTKAISYIDISASGRNLWLSTKYNGVDPETSLTGAGSNISGLDWFNNPGTKSYGIAIKVGF